MKIIKIILWTFFIGIVCYILIIFLFVLAPDINNYRNRISFDSNKWIEWIETEAEPSLRWNMVKDLTKNYQLTGMTVEEIIALLGEPSFQNKKELRYYLGMSGHGIDTGSLTLFIHNGKIIEYKISHG